jgi:hypothetical protein
MQNQLPKQKQSQLPKQIKNELKTLLFEKAKDYPFAFLIFKA